MGGMFFLFWGGKLNNKKITKIKYNEGVRWPPFDILQATTNQKQAGMMEEGWDRLHNHARMLRDPDGNDEPLAEGNNDDNYNDEYDKDGYTPHDSVPPAESIARLRPESQRASVPSR